MKWFCLFILLLVGCRNSVSYPHDETSAAKLIDTTYAGSAEALSGEDRLFSLILEEDGQENLTYKLAVIYVGRSTRPTVRTGNWYSDGETLTLVIEEQDGEPTRQDPITFTIANDKLTAATYNTERFDFKSFILEASRLD